MRMIYIHLMNLNSLDLNLLVALDALLREANVSRAAMRIGLSQPAASHALQRLREGLGDPLLAMISVIVIHTWQWTPFAFMVLL